MSSGDEEERFEKGERMRKAKYEVEEVKVVSPVIAERRLLAAVIERAVRDAMPGAQGLYGVNVSIRSDARAWLFDATYESELTFSSCCEYLELDEDLMRKAIFRAIGAGNLNLLNGLRTRLGLMTSSTWGD